MHAAPEPAPRVRLALELPADLLNQALPLRDDDIMQRLADTLNDLKVPRLVDGLGDIVDRRYEDETCRRCTESTGRADRLMNFPPMTVVYDISRCHNVR